MSTFEKGFKRKSPGLYKDNHKKADDVGLGSTNSYKFTFKSKASNGTSVKTSQEVKHAGGAVTKLAMKFKKVNGFHLEKFDASSNGAISGSVAFTEAGPGVDISFGAAKYVSKDQGKRSVFASVNYVHDLLNANAKFDYGKMCFNGDINVGYENFLLGGTVDVALDGTDMKQKFGAMVGTTFGNSSLLTIQGTDMTGDSKTMITGYFLPAKGVELAFSGEKTTGAANGGVEASIRSKFALDDNDTSLVASLTTTPLTVLGDDSSAKFRVGLSYAQKLRDWASLKVSGEVGIKDVKHVAFGIELETGSI